GANLRILIVYLFKSISLSLSFPVGILIANCLGCLLAGALLHLQTSKNLPAYVAPLISVGFFGALTTFSTFAVDCIKLFRVSYSNGLMNIGANLSICLILVLVGESLCKKLYSSY
ncbi:CrcB family protein, partial [bacterium]|nr:CrcB family protein [bacterium]